MEFVGSKICYFTYNDHTDASGLHFTHTHTGEYHVVGRHYTATDNLVIDPKEQSKMFVGKSYHIILFSFE